MSVTILCQNLVIPGGTTTFAGTWGSTADDTGHSWGTLAVSGYSYHAAGTGTNNCQWNFTGLTAGKFQCALAWDEGPNRATNTPWEILDSDGTTQLATGTVDQTIAASADYTNNGGNGNNAPFKKLGSAVTITGTSLTVKITDNANNFVIANAALIEPVAAPATTAGGAALLAAM